MTRRTAPGAEIRERACTLSVLLLTTRQLSGARRRMPLGSHARTPTLHLEGRLTAKSEFTVGKNGDGHSGSVHQPYQVLGCQGQFGGPPPPGESVMSH